MSNRRKRRFFKGTPQENRLEIASRGIAQVSGNVDPSLAGDPLFSSELTDEERELMVKLTMPASEAEVIKVVPAKVDGVEVGTAFIHDDGQVSITFHEDADEDKMEKIKATAMSVGYNLETGEDHGSA